MPHIVKQLARGATAVLDVYTGPAGELLMDTTTKELVLHDGTTQGGIRIGSGGGATYTAAAPLSIDSNNEISIADATTSSKGVVQVGTNLSVANGVLSVQPFVIHVTSSGSIDPTTLPEGCIIETDEPIAESLLGVVDLTTAQTINGVKTFVDSPIVPVPSASGEAATKGYVDDTMDCGELE